MPYTLVGSTKPTVAGTLITPAAADATGNAFNNGGNQMLVVLNDSGVTVTVTVDAPGTFQGVTLADATVAVAAGARKVIGPFHPAAFNQSDGTVHVDYSAVTSVTVYVIED